MSDLIVMTFDGETTAQTVRDITHERATKARILELNATLEQQVSERTAQLVALSTRERAILADAASAIIATDVDGDSLTYAAGSTSPSHGTVTVNGDGS